MDVPEPPRVENAPQGQGNAPRPRPVGPVPLSAGRVPPIAGALAPPPPPGRLRSELLRIRAELRQAMRVPVTALTITGILLLPLYRLGHYLLFNLLMTSEIPDPIEVVLGVLDVVLPLGIVVLACFAFFGSRRRGRIEFGVFCIAVFIALSILSIWLGDLFLALLKFAIGLVFLADIGGVG